MARTSPREKFIAKLTALITTANLSRRTALALRCERLRGILERMPDEEYALIFRTRDHLDVGRSPVRVSEDVADETLFEGDVL